MSLSIPPKWGIRLFALWALLLAVLAAGYLLILSASVELYSDEYSNQAQVWLIFALNIGFTVGFTAAAYGLWLQLKWGRILFLWLIVFWNGVNLLSLLAPALLMRAALPPPLALALDLARYGLALLIPLVYLNLPHIKACFIGQPAESI